MIKVTILYPNAPSATFDMQYYVTHHLPMVRDRCAPACHGIAAEGGVAGAEPGSQAPYIAVGHLTFDSLAAFQKAFTPHAPEILADVPNYTNTRPIIQISEIAL
ncbi:MAG: EthD family reductase [Deltaproteobacteria bacterium]|nr:MAG: EthD family reductase [Deltaproteobacteria bacterium]TMQ23624.1 MAG: EthD family reductase [Deltaproteobacteria bacterium]